MVFNETLLTIFIKRYLWLSSDMKATTVLLFLNMLIISFAKKKVKSKNNPDPVKKYLIRPDGVLVNGAHPCDLDIDHLDHCNHDLHWDHCDPCDRCDHCNNCFHHCEPPIVDHVRNLFAQNLFYIFLGSFI